MPVHSNAAEVGAMLQGLAATISDPAPALERARLMIAESEAETFSGQGANLGTPWPGSADPGRSADERMLVASGALRGSVTTPSAGEITAGDTLKFGTDVEYGHFHQYGTGRMPARPFLGITPNLARDLVTLLQEAVEAKIK